MGGLSRKYTVINQIMRSEDILHLLVDSGNFLFPATKQQQLSNAQNITAKGIADIYHEMHYDAVNVGVNDLSAGLSFIKKMDFLPLVSANFFDNSGQTLFQQYIVKSGKHLKLGILGLTGPPAVTPIEYIYRPWRNILPSLVNELNQKVDCIVVLSSLSDKENEEIAQKFPEVRLIFSAIYSSGNNPPKLVNKAIITQTASRGRYLGQIFLQSPGLYEWEDNSSSTKENRDNQIKAIKYRLSRIEFLKKQNLGKKSVLESLDRQEIALQNKLTKFEKQNHDDVNISTSRYKSAYIPLSSNVQESQRINRIVKGVKENIQTLDQ